LAWSAAGRAYIGGIGDIGTHVYRLAGFVAGLKAEAVCADLTTFVADRSLDDNAHVMIGRDDLGPSAALRTRTPPGHPEGYFKAFANLHSGFAEAIRAQREAREPSALGSNIPTSYDGLKGAAFVDAVVDSQEKSPFGWIVPSYR